MILAFIAEEAAGVEITPEQCGFSNSSRPVYDKGLPWSQMRIKPYKSLYNFIHSTSIN